MPQTGHVLIGAEGELIGVDSVFCEIMQADRDAIRGRFVLAVTAPADRQECADAIKGLRETGQPFTITKRFLRDDGSLVWVKNSVSLALGLRDEATIVATIEPVEIDEAHAPAMLLDSARAFAAAHRARTAVFDTILFAEPGWDAMIAAYIAEAEGHALDAASLAQTLGLSGEATRRWIHALLQREVLEIEYRNPSATAPKAYRVTAHIHKKLEHYLGRYGSVNRETGTMTFGAGR
jgi:PAS domain S-box-containing protein